MKVYSLNKEDWYADFEEAVHEALENEYVAGNIYYESEGITVTSNKVFRRVMLAERIEEALFDLVGENFEDYTGNEARKELEAAVCAWIDKHLRPSSYYQVSNNVKEVAFTEEDLQE